MLTKLVNKSIYFLSEPTSHTEIKKKAFIRLISLFLISCHIQPTLAQDYLFDIETINVKDGLPHRNTFDIVQDKDGFIWVSTLGAISRYDGYSFKTYKHFFLNILENGTAHLAVDVNNYLWYCERHPHKNEHISGVIDTKKDTIYNMETFSKGLFTSKDIFYIRNSRINKNEVLIITKDGIMYKYNGSFEKIYRIPYPIATPVFCEENPDGSYWIGVRNNIIKVKDKSDVKIFPSIYKGEANNVRTIDLSGISDTGELVIEFDLDNIILSRWKLENGSIFQYTLKNYKLNEITNLLWFYKNNICYATKDKLVIGDNHGNGIHTYGDLDMLKKGQGLRHQATLLDRQNILWVTTTDGLLKISVSKKSFKVIEPGNSIRGIYQIHDQLWIGGYRENIVRDTANDNIRKTLPFATNVIMSFYKDDQKHLLMGVSDKIGEFLEYIPEEDNHISYKFDIDFFFQLPFQNAVTKNYWIGTNNGVFKFDKDEKKVTPFQLPISSDNLYIRQFYEHSQGIWIVSNKGIFLMDNQKEIILKHYTTADGLPSDNINYIYEDKDKFFWIGTKGDGLVRWNRSTNIYKQYTTANGLSNDNIYAVYEDDFETLWLSSDYGLMAFDKTTETIRLYLPQNGISHEEFNTFSHFQGKDGTLYFGGLNGITKFHPKDLRQEYGVKPPLHIIELRVLEKNREEFTDCTYNYQDTHKINLHSDDRILKVGLTFLDYKKSDENQYAYKLTMGNQDQWIYTTDHTLSIINPPCGNYSLVIKARGSSGIWSDHVSIPIYKPLPFYRRWWFLLIGIVIISFIVVLGVKWRVKRLEKDRQRLEIEVQKRIRKIEQDKQIIEKQAEDLRALDQAKDRFFANITHEFRTPLTLIIGPIEQLMTSITNTSARVKMELVQSNAKQLLRLINQLLDISRLEDSQPNVKASKADIVAFMYKLSQGFQSMALGKKQQLRFKSDLNTWETYFDIEICSKIVYNLISNAIKYTLEGGKVEILVFKIGKNDKTHIGIQVKDTGIGIERSMLAHIFKRFYQADDSATRQREGTGIGLTLVKELVELQNGKIMVESQLGKGSVFTIILPVLDLSLHPDASFESPDIEAPMIVPIKKVNVNKIQSDGTSGHNKLKLLIIEDNEQMRAYIHSCMDPSAYYISEAADGQQGIEKALKLVPDLIISDIMMPGKDGFEVVQAIRSHTATSHIPLILLTAKASEENRLKGLERGADVYLTKPFNPTELNLRVKKLIEIRRLLHIRYQKQIPGDTFTVFPQTQPVFQQEDIFITRFKNYFLEHITETELKPEQISNYLGISRTQLFRKIKTLTDRSLGEYIRFLRCEKAAELIKTRKFNISEIAYETGFSSPSYFSQAFKKEYGIAPSLL